MNISEQTIVTKLQEIINKYQFVMLTSVTRVDANQELTLYLFGLYKNGYIQDFHIVEHYEQDQLAFAIALQTDCGADWSYFGISCIGDDLNTRYERAMTII